MDHSLTLGLVEWTPASTGRRRHLYASHHQPPTRPPFHLADRVDDRGARTWGDHAGYDVGGFEAYEGHSCRRQGCLFQARTCRVCGEAGLIVQYVEQRFNEDHHVVLIRRSSYFLNVLCV